MLLRMEVTEDTNTLYEYSGGLKCWHLSTDISKNSKPLPSFLKQSSILNKMDGNESFLATTLLGEWGHEGMNPNPFNKLSLGA